MKFRKVTALLLAGVLAASVALTGCGSDDAKSDSSEGTRSDYAFTSVATFDGEEIPYKLGRFLAKMQQASYDGYYGAYYGTALWSQSIDSEGTTMEDSVKDNVLESLETLYVLEKNMDQYNIEITDEEMEAIKAAAEQFISDNTEEALLEMGATQEIVERYLYLYTVTNKMYDAITAEVDTEVSDEEAAQRTFSYVRISKGGTTDEDGNYVEPAEEDVQAASDKADEFVTEAKVNYDDACESLELTSSTFSYGVNDDPADTGMDEALIEAANALAEGEISGVVETDTDYYVLRLDAEYDEEATESRKEEIVSEREADHYEEVVTAMKEKVTFEVDEIAWESIKFNMTFSITTNEESEE